VFAGLARQKVDALLINTDPFLFGQREEIVQLAARYKIPTLYFLRECVDAGGLMSYGPTINNGYRQAGIYVGRILKGEKVGELQKAGGDGGRRSAEPPASQEAEAASSALTFLIARLTLLDTV